MTKKIAWVTMTVLAMLVGVYAGLSLVTSAVRPALLQNLFDTVPIAVTVHLAGGLVAIVVGAFQVNSRLRARFLSAHRLFGRLYLVGVAVSAPAGFALALTSDGGLVGHFGFGMLAVTWLFSTGNAFRHIRAGDRITHRAWMYRSYALTLAAVTLRLYLPAFGMAGYGFDVAYPLISWICWVPNLLVVEWIVLTRTPKTATAG
jgi:uncharacterized membrane protein